MNTIIQIKKRINRDVFDYQQLLECLKTYSKPRDKIRQLVADGDITRVKKGLYVFGEAYRSAPVSRELLANLIYGPSYVSLDYALAWYGLIPERVEVVTSVTTGRSREFRTSFGVFSYRRMTESRYASGAVLRKTGDAHFLSASPEKALADKVWTDKRFAGTGQSQYETYLADDLRIDMSRLASLDRDRLNTVKWAYSSPKIDRLIRYLLQLKETDDA